MTICLYKQSDAQGEENKAPLIELVLLYIRSYCVMEESTIFITLDAKCAIATQGGGGK